MSHVHGALFLICFDKKFSCTGVSIFFTVLAGLKKPGIRRLNLHCSLVSRTFFYEIFYRFYKILKNRYQNRQKIEQVAKYTQPKMIGVSTEHFWKKLLYNFVQIWPFLTFF